MPRAKRIPSSYTAPDFSRRTRHREPYDRVLIVCEGMTEKIYFEGLAFSLGLSSANIRISPSSKGTDPIQIVRYGIALSKEAHREGDAFQRLYCVFDLDRPHQDALDLVGKTNLPKTTLHLAISNPCFEIWLRLHFGYTDKSYSAVGNKSACQSVGDDLIALAPYYNKGNAGLFSLFAHLIQDAVTNSRKLESVNRQTSNTNPSCSVHELVDYLSTLREQKNP